MYMLIAKWHGKFNGEEYTLLFTKEPHDAFYNIDVMGDPYLCTYVLWDIEKVMEYSFGGIETQEQIKAWYEDGVKETLMGEMSFIDIDDLPKKKGVDK